MRSLPASVAARLPSALQRCPLPRCNYHGQASFINKGQRSHATEQWQTPQAPTAAHHFTCRIPCGRRLISTPAVAERTEAPPWAGQPAADRLVLVDASSMMYRMHFGYGVGMDQRLMSELGEDTTITYGFLNSVINLLTLNPPPTHFAAAFDSGGGSGQAGTTFRHQLYSEYKAQRASMPEDIKTAWPRVKEMLQAINIPTFELPGVEADDVIGTLARRAVAEDMQVAIVSTDQDFYQLLGPGVQMLKPPKRGMHALVGGMVPYNETAFQAEHGVTPQQWPDVKALAGDNSDNIPGVKGIGPKRAATMIAQAGNLEQLLAHADEVKLKSAREVLSTPEAAQIARLGLRLVTIQDDLDFPPIRQSLEGLRLRPPSSKARDAAARLFADLNFKQAPGKLDKIWQRMEQAAAQ